MVKPFRIDGVDISHWQSGSLDFAAAERAGVRWVYHKATEGIGYTDPRYASRRTEIARESGLLFGAYHFARPDKKGSDGLAEAHHFLSVAKPKPGDMRPMLDLEDRNGLTRKALTKWVGDFVREVERATGHPPFIYTPFDLDEHFNCPLWTARYNDKNEPPRIPEPWKIYTIHQFSNGSYGKPKSVPGLGNVDLNTMNGDPARLTKVFQLPKPDPKPDPKPKPGKSARLKFAHLSMETGDKKAQQQADLDAVFSRGYDVITGTEAGHGTGVGGPLLKGAATKHGYLLSKITRFDTWVAVKKSLVAGGWRVGADFVLPASTKFEPKPPGRWGDKGITWIEWDMGPTYGRFAVGAVHYLSHSGAGKVYKAETDRLYATAVTQWAKKHGSGTTLAFVGGDFNLLINRNDVFKGGPLTTCWTDLKKYPATHGPNNSCIDALARYNHDTRVSLAGARVLTDKQLPLNTDHFLVEAEYDVAPLG